MSNQNDFVQPAATVYLGSAPQSGVFYECKTTSQYCLATGDKQKNGKHIVYMHDLFCGPRKKVVKVGMDDYWFSGWKRCETVPARVYALLTEARNAK